MCGIWSVLSSALDWRRPVGKESDAIAYEDQPPSFSTYVRLLTWFFDHPSALSPFSVHRFALIGKQLGKEVGQWFGPSTAAGAIK